MVLLPAGVFTMGSDDFYPDERPVHERTVEAFWIDRHQVTNAEFARFVAETGYVTVAERPLEASDYPDLPAEDLVPGSLVFTPTTVAVDLRDWRQWWRWEPGAQWRHPEGLGSSIDERMSHPVVQVAFEDAEAYARWAGKRLPTEAEAEYAARGGREGTPFAWGDAAFPDDVAQANTWIGRFPYDNRGRFGASTAPVGSYPANGYGLFDTIGNVWEWTSDYYSPRHVVPGSVPVDRGARSDLMASASAEVGSSVPRRVLKGGSYLCSPDYCLRFRPAARSPQADDSSTTHIGFRCARDA
ncbi:formylglycine-generating enzyme family protein [Microbacterium sp. 4R-513]|uniref:formylglycine-generating enzyme family protein n=1 Tax=Microbacterium sp. 4R-513 TaxID=2567934 RepID=UPI0013E19C81|nr:formylglycine-generating enzyme family protein [Microbacterium sp. 4R-513]QIG41119.1 formylglycine-generating enzyme family protein [Microbacterium sp. 4R-513]